MAGRTTDTFGRMRGRTSRGSIARLRVAPDDPRGRPSCGVRAKEGPILVAQVRGAASRERLDMR